MRKWLNWIPICKKNSVFSFVTLFSLCRDEKDKKFNVEQFFHPFISEWLDTADEKFLEWINPAVTADNVNNFLKFGFNVI